MLKWALPATAAACLWATSDIITKYILNTGLDYKLMFLLGAVFYFLMALVYFIVNKDSREKLFKLNDLSFNKKIILLVLLLIFSSTWACAELLIDYAYSITNNIGYVRSITAIGILLIYFYSLFFMGAELNKFTFLGILLVFSGIYLIMNYSGND